MMLHVAVRVTGYHEHADIDLLRMGMRVLIHLLPTCALCGQRSGICLGSRSGCPPTLGER